MSVNAPIRTRFAPSPTGELHIGGLWTALMGWLSARHAGGTFILRIEDTDRKRFVPGAEDRIIEALHWFGLDYDEGPDCGGAYGPYRQSERLAIYRRYADELLEHDAAYRCFCSPERLATLKEEQQRLRQPLGYDGHCRTVPVAEAATRAKSELHVIRLRVPREGGVTFRDRIRGTVTFANSTVDDQVLMKSDGWPTYHLAGVVDDHLMEINPVIRGEEWLPSTPKQLLLYRALGWEPPEYAHLPLILGSDRTKFSKRHGAMAALDLRRDGYLAEAVLNFLALLGWHPKDEREVLTVPELVAAFSIDDVHKAGAIFDQGKLEWLNATYVRKLSSDELLNKAAPFLQESGIGNEETIQQRVRQGLAVIQERLRTLREIPEQLKVFLEDPPQYEPDLLVWKKSDRTTARERLQAMRDTLSSIDDASFGSADTLEKRLRDHIVEHGLGIGETLWPLRVALSGSAESPPPFAIAAVLGKQESLKRVTSALTLLS